MSESTESTETFTKKTTFSDEDVTDADWKARYAAEKNSAAKDYLGFQADKKELAARGKGGLDVSSIRQDHAKEIADNATSGTQEAVIKPIEGGLDNLNDVKRANINSDYKDQQKKDARIAEKRQRKEAKAAQKRQSTAGAAPQKPDTEPVKDEPADTEPENVPEQPSPEQEQAKKYFSRLSTLRDIGVQGLNATANALRQSEKQYDGLIKLTGALMTGKPLSIASQALSTTMTGFSTIGDVIEDEKKALGIKPGVDPMKLQDDLAIKRPGKYEDLNKAVAAERLVNSTYNKYLQEAAAGKDITQLTDSELKYVHDRMNEFLQDDYNRVRSKPRDQWNAEDKAFYEAYMAVENGIGRQARSLSSQHAADDRQMRQDKRYLKEREKQLQDTLKQNQSAWYRSGQMTDPKQINAYMRELDSKVLAGVALTPEEQADLDDMKINHGWRREVQSMQVDMTNDARLIPLWTQKAGTSLSEALGGDAAVMDLYAKAQAGDIQGIKRMLDTPEKVSAATGFAKLGIANATDANLFQRNPMSSEDIVLGYAIDSAISGREFKPPVQYQSDGSPKWLIRKQIAEKKRELAEAERAARAARRTTAKLNATDGQAGNAATRGKPYDDGLETKLTKIQDELVALRQSLGPGEIEDVEEEVKRNPKKKNGGASKNAKKEVEEPLDDTGAPEDEPWLSWNTPELKNGQLGKQIDTYMDQMLQLKEGTPEYKDAYNKYVAANLEAALDKMRKKIPTKYTREQFKQIERLRDEALKGHFGERFLENEFNRDNPLNIVDRIFDRKVKEKINRRKDMGNPNVKMVQDPAERAKLDRLQQEARDRIEQNADSLRKLIGKSTFNNKNPVAIVQNMIDNEDATDEELYALDDLLKKEGSELRKIIGPLYEDYDSADSNATNDNFKAKFKDVFDHLDKIETALEMLHPDMDEMDDEEDEEDEIETEEAIEEPETKETKHRNDIYSAGRVKLNSVRSNLNKKGPKKRYSGGEWHYFAEDGTEIDKDTYDALKNGAKTPKTVAEEPKKVIEEPKEVDKEPDDSKKQTKRSKNLKGKGTKNKPSDEQIAANNMVDYLGRKNMEQSISDLRTELDGLKTSDERNKYIAKGIAANQKVIDGIVKATGMTEEQLCKYPKKKGMDKAEIEQMIEFFNARVNRDFLNSQRNVKTAPEEPKQNAAPKVEHKKTTKAPVKALNNSWSARPRGYKGMTDDEYKAFATTFISKTVMPDITKGVPAETQLISYLEQRDNLSKRLQKLRDEGRITGDEEEKRLKDLELKIQVLGAWLDYRQKNNPTGKKKIYGVPKSKKKLVEKLNPRD